MTKIDQKYQESALLIGQADLVLITAGAGMSVPAGINYHDKLKFAELFPRLVKKGYTMQYALITHHAVDERRGWSAKVKWGYLAAHVNNMYYQIQKDATYQRLYSLVKQKDYFVMTTNVDGLFLQNEFNAGKIYTPQGQIENYPMPGSFASIYALCRGFNNFINLLGVRAWHHIRHAEQVLL